MPKIPTDKTGRLHRDKYSIEAQRAATRKMFNRLSGRQVEMSEVVEKEGKGSLANVHPSRRRLIAKAKKFSTLDEKPK